MPSLGMSPAGDLQIAFHGAGDTLAYGIHRDGEWDLRNVAGEGGNVPQMAVGNDGTTHVVHMTYEGLGYARLADGAADWTNEAIPDIHRNVGFSSEIAVDASGGVHIVTVDYPNSDRDDGTLKYAYRDGAGTWKVDSLVLPGYEPTVTEDPHVLSLAVTPEGRVYLAFDGLRGENFFMERSPEGTWSPKSSLLETSGWGPALALDGNLRPHVVIARDEGGLVHAMLGCE
jgi:hypothetical protein